MLSTSVLTLALGLGLVSLVTSSPIAEPIRVRTPTDRSSWVSVDFEGHTIQYNPATHVTINDAFHAKRELTRRVSDNTCGASTFYSGIAPYPSVADCEVLKTWVYSLHEAFTVSDPNNFHGLVSAGTCEFSATASQTNTYVGSQDIGDLIGSSISGFQYNGLIGASGNMYCGNGNGGDESRTYWEIIHT